MKNPLQYIREYPQRTKQILGISDIQFEDLLNQAKLKFKQLEIDQEYHKKRINRQGCGRERVTFAISIYTQAALRGLPIKPFK